VTALDRKDYLQLAALVALAACARLYRLGEASLWLDEVFTLRMASLPWRELWEPVYTPVNAVPPLYFSLLHPLVHEGIDPWLLRLPGALLGTATVVLVYLVTRHLWDRRAALFTGLLLALSMANIEYSQEARSYVLVSFCIGLSFLGIMQLEARWPAQGQGLQPGPFLRRGGALYAVGLLAALLSHNTAVFYWLGAQCFFLAWWSLALDRQRAVLLGWILVNLVVLIAWSPWLLASLEVSGTSVLGHFRQPSPLRAASTWAFVNGVQLSRETNIPLALVSLSLMLWGLWCLRRNRVMLLAFAAMILCSSLLTWAFGFISTPVFIKKTILWGSLFSLPLMGIGIAGLGRRWDVFALAALLVVAAAGFWNYNRNDWAENQDWHSAVAVLEKGVRPGDTILLRNTSINRPFLYHMPAAADLPLLGWNCREGGLYAGQVVRDLSQRRAQWRRNPSALGAAAGRALWVVESHCYSQEHRGAIDARIARRWYAAGSHRFRNVRVYRWAPRERRAGQPD